MLQLNPLRKGRMSTKLYIFLAWIFYLAVRQTADPVWQFCLIYSCVLAVCAFFYRNGHKGKGSKKRGKSK
jgi:hypothetical protein